MAEYKHDLGPDLNVEESGADNYCLPEDWGLLRSTHMVVLYHLDLQFQGLYLISPLWAPAHTWYTFMLSGTHIHIFKCFK